MRIPVMNLADIFRLVMVGLITCFIACQHDPRPARTTSHIRMLDEQVIRYNQGIIRTEEQEITDFIRRYRWEMKRTSTGLRYMIYYTGSGKAAVKGMQASVRFTLRLLNGQQIYSSDSAGLKEITLGYSGVETGLEEGLLHLHQGDRAKFIIPSYLAFGLLGDQHKIPPGATLVYDLELVDLKIPGNGNP